MDSMRYSESQSLAIILILFEQLVPQQATSLHQPIRTLLQLDYQQLILSSIRELQPSHPRFIAQEVLQYKDARHLSPPFNFPQDPYNPRSPYAPLNINIYTFFRNNFLRLQSQMRKRCAMLNLRIEYKFKIILGIDLLRNRYREIRLGVDIFRFFRNFKISDRNDHILFLLSCLIDDFVIFYLVEIDADQF